MPYSDSEADGFTSLYRIILFSILFALYLLLNPNIYDRLPIFYLALTMSRSFQSVV